MQNQITEVILTSVIPCNKEMQEPSLCYTGSSGTAQVPVPMTMPVPMTTTDRAIGSDRRAWN